MSFFFIRLNRRYCLGLQRLRLKEQRPNGYVGVPPTRENDSNKILYLLPMYEDFPHLLSVLSQSDPSTSTALIATTRLIGELGMLQGVQPVNVPFEHVGLQTSPLIGKCPDESKSARKWCMNTWSMRLLLETFSCPLEQAQGADTQRTGAAA